MWILSIILFLQVNGLFASFNGKQGENEISELSIHKTNCIPLVFTQNQKFQFDACNSLSFIFVTNELFQRDTIKIKLMKQFLLQLVTPPFLVNSGIFLQKSTKNNYMLCETISDLWSTTSLSSKVTFLAKIFKRGIHIHMLSKHEKFIKKKSNSPQIY